MTPEEPGTPRRPDEEPLEDPTDDGLVVEPDEEIDLSDVDEPEVEEPEVEDAPVADEPVEDEPIEDEPVEDEPVDDEPDDAEAAELADHPVDDEEWRAEDEAEDEWTEDDAVEDEWADEPDVDEHDADDTDDAAWADDEPPAGAIHPDPEEDEHLLHPPASPAADRDPDPEPDGTETKPRRRRRRLVLLAFLVVLGLAYVAGWWLTGTRMPASATIGGVDVGGMSPAAARSALDEALSPRRDQPVDLVHEDKTFEVDPADAGLALDVERSVEEAGGVRSWDPRDMVALFWGDHEHAPALDVEDDKLEGVVATIAESVDVPVVEALITFPDAEPKPREPKAGLVVRKADTAAAIRGAYLVEDEPVAVPTAVVEPVVDDEGLARAVEEIGEPAVSAPVLIQVGRKEVELPVTAYAPALVVRVVDGAMTPQIDPEDLAEPLTDATTGIGRKAVDATVVIRGGKPVVVPGKEGVGLQPEEMAEKLVPVLTRTGEDRAVQIEAKVVEPQRTTADAKKLNIKEKVSEFSTTFPHAEYRNVNQARAAELINGVIVEPGETFSFNDTVGERAEANGFTSGTVINGGVFREELGGGVSQVVTTVYNAAFFAGMDDVEHHPHAFYIDRYPVGREATVYYGSLDLRFKNPTKHGVLIRAFVDRSTPGTSGRTTVQLWSTKVWDIEAGKSARRNFRQPSTQYDDTNRCVPQGPVQGFDIDIYRTFKKGGEVTKRETVTARYQAADRVVCGKKPDDD